MSADLPKGSPETDGLSEEDVEQMANDYASWCQHWGLRLLDAIRRGEDEYMDETEALEKEIDELDSEARKYALATALVGLSVLTRALQEIKPR